MVQFFGRPQGPLSFAAGSSVSIAPDGFGVVVGVAVGPVEAFCAAVVDGVPLVAFVVPAPAAATSCVFPAFLAPSSHAKLTLETAL